MERVLFSFSGPKHVPYLVYYKEQGYWQTILEKNKTAGARVNMILGRVRVTVVSVERQ
jgi:hypothetical protein